MIRKSIVASLVLLMLVEMSQAADVSVDIDIPLDVIDLNSESRWITHL